MDNNKFFQSWRETTPTKIVDLLQRIAEEVKKSGGRAFLVGGCVRDIFFGFSPKDWDIEVHGLSADIFYEVATRIGKVSEVGKSFGVLKIVQGDIDIDVGLPRRDSKVSQGHVGFSVSTDAHMGILEATRRRDFTINAILCDPLTGDLFDPFGGIEDIRTKTLRIVDTTTFGDDPLRILRAIQFIARFGLTLEENSFNIIQNHLSELQELPKERIYEEWKKLLIKSEKPSLGLSVAMSLDIFKYLHKEFLPMITTPQDPIWHPEGNVWIHTLMVLDEAAMIAKREKLNTTETLILLLAAWCHDIGKPITTTLNEHGRIIAHGHDVSGEQLTKNFLISLGVDDLTTRKVTRLVANHLAVQLLYTSETKKLGTVSPGAIRRLAKRLHPATIYELTILSEADHRGRGKKEDDDRVGQYNADAEKWLLEKAHSLSVDTQSPKSLTVGQEWLDLGYSPGKIIGELIKIADELRDSKNYTKEMILSCVKGIDSAEAALHLLRNHRDTDV